MLSLIEKYYPKYESKDDDLYYTLLKEDLNIEKDTISLLNFLAKSDFDIDRVFFALSLGVNDINTRLEGVVIDKLNQNLKFITSKIFKGDMGYDDSDLAEIRKDKVSRKLISKVKSSMEISVALADNMYKLANKEIDLINKETKMSIDKLGNIDDGKLEVEGIKPGDLSKLLTSISKSTSKVTVAHSWFKLESAIKGISSIENAIPLLKQVENPKVLMVNRFKPLTIKYMSKYEPNLVNAIKSIKKDADYIGLVNLKVVDGFILKNGISPPYKQPYLENINFTIDLTNKQHLVELFSTKSKLLLPLLDKVKELKGILQPIPSLYSKLEDKLNKYIDEDINAFYATIHIAGMVANRMRFLSLLVHKELKGIKWISRKIRLIQTRIKHFKEE